MIIGVVVDENIREFWLEVFETDRVPLISRAPTLMYLPYIDRVSLVYQVKMDGNLDAFKMYERERLSKALIRKFGMNADDLRKFLLVFGFPLSVDAVKVE